MAEVHGVGTALGLGPETTWGTAEARTTWFAPAGACTIERRQEWRTRESLAFQGGFMPRKAYLAEDRTTGSVDLWVQYAGFGLIWMYLLSGTPSTTGPTSGMYAHVFAIAGTLPAGMTAEVQLGTGGSRLCPGTRINKATIVAEAGKEMKISLDLASKTATDGTAVTPTYTASRDMVVSHLEAGSFLWNSVSYVLDKIKITVDNKFYARQSLSAATPSALTRQGMMEITCEIELITDSMAFEVAHLAHTESDGVITFTSVGLGGETLTFNVNKCYVSKVTAPINSVGPIKKTVTLVAQADSSDEGLKITAVTTSANPLAA